MPTSARDADGSAPWSRSPLTHADAPGSEPRLAGASQQALEVAEAGAPAVLVHAHRLLVTQAAVRKADRCDAAGLLETDFDQRLAALPVPRPGEGEALRRLAS